MTFVAASTTKGRLRQFLSWPFWIMIFREVLRFLVFGPRPKRWGQWVYHPHRQTWEWRESPTVWYPKEDHP